MAKEIVRTELCANKLELTTLNEEWTDLAVYLRAKSAQMDAFGRNMLQTMEFECEHGCRYTLTRELVINHVSLRETRSYAHHVKAASKEVLRKLRAVFGSEDHRDLGVRIWDDAALELTSTRTVI